MHFISIIGFTSHLFTSNSYFTITLANIFFYPTMMHLSTPQTVEPMWKEIQYFVLYT